MDISANHLSPPVLIDNAQAQGNLEDDQVIEPEDNRKKRHSSQVSNSDNQANSKAKRQLFSTTVEGCSEPLPLPSSVIGANSEVSIPTLSSEHQDDDDISSNYCLVGATGLPQPLPFIPPAQPLVDTAGPSGDHLQPVYNVTKVFTRDMDSDEFNSYINGTFILFHFVHHPNFFWQPYITCSSYNSLTSFALLISDYPQLPEDPPIGEGASVPAAAANMDATIEQISLNCAKQLLVTVLTGLDVITLRNPSRRDQLLLASKCIASDFASTSRIKEMLNRLIAISEELEKAYTEYEENSKCMAETVEATRLELANKREVLQATAQEKAAIEKQQDEILAEIARLNDTLQNVKQKAEQASEVWSVHNLEVQQLEHELNDAVAGANQKAADSLHGITGGLSAEAEKLFTDLKNVNANLG
jgi:hypothetical protein